MADLWHGLCSLTATSVASCEASQLSLVQGLATAEALQCAMPIVREQYTRQVLAAQLLQSYAKDVNAVCHDVWSQHAGHSAWLTGCCSAAASQSKQHQHTFQMLLACWTTCMLQVTHVTRLVRCGKAMHACSCSIKSHCVLATNKSVLEQIGFHRMSEL